MKFQYSSAKSGANLDSLKQRLTDQIIKHLFTFIDGKVERRYKNNRMMRIFAHF